MRMKIKKYEKLLIIASVTLAAFFFTEIAVAAASSSGISGPSIGAIASNITKSFGALAKLITAGSYIAGFGFSLGAILKFKQHKDNPQQIPIGTPIAMLFVAAALIFLPTIFGTANQTIFGGSGVIGGTGGVAT
jgi:intracellular multiplication protein IcmD